MRPPNQGLVNNELINILHTAEIDKDGIGCNNIIICFSNPFSCAIPWGDKIKSGSYFYVMENRIETNRPYSRCCSLYDNIEVLYYDRILIDKIDKAKCCNPMCTHNSCCPTCFDMCGEGIVLHGSRSCCSDCIPHDNESNFSQRENCNCCCLSFDKKWAMRTGLKDAGKVIQLIKDAKKNYKNRSLVYDRLEEMTQN